MVSMFKLTKNGIGLGGDNEYRNFIKTSQTRKKYDIKYVI